MRNFQWKPLRMFVRLMGAGMGIFIIILRRFVKFRQKNVWILTN